MRRAFLSGPHLAYVRPPEGSVAFPWPPHLQRPEPQPVPEKPAAAVTTLPSDLATRWAVASDLAPPLQLALLELRNTYIAKACAKKLRYAGVWNCGADIESLKRSGLIVSTSDLRRLTPRGMVKADECAHAVAKQYNLHCVTRGGGFRQHTIRCSCGWTTSFTCSPARKESTFVMHELRHLEKVET